MACSAAQNEGAVLRVLLPDGGFEYRPRAESEHEREYQGSYALAHTAKVRDELPCHRAHPSLCPKH